MLNINEMLQEEGSTALSKSNIPIFLVHYINTILCRVRCFVCRYHKSHTELDFRLMPITAVTPQHRTCGHKYNQRFILTSGSERLLYIPSERYQVLEHYYCCVTYVPTVSTSVTPPIISEVGLLYWHFMTVIRPKTKSPIRNSAWDFWGNKKFGSDVYWS